MADEVLSAYEPSIAPDMRKKIETRLQEIERDFEVEILFAVESGSRAWGCPSPDSDYDVRFVYRHKLDWYLSLKPGRDVIELPIADNLDMGGWELRKALNLLVRSNPTLLEWLASPVRYIWRDEADDLAQFAQQSGVGGTSQAHYLHLGEKSWERTLQGEDRAHYKRLFYALRSAMVLRWIRHHPDLHPPMNFQALCQGCVLSKGLLKAIKTLMQKKEAGKEQYIGPRLPEIEAFIRDEFLQVQNNASDMPALGLDDEAEGLFREIVKQDIILATRYF